MILNGTFVKLDRRILNWRWYKNGNTARLFIHLILKANTVDRDIGEVTVLRGQLLTSRKTLSEELRLTEREIRTALEHLKTTNEITCVANPGYTLITVTNYDLYQNSFYQKATDERPTSDQAATNERPSCDQQATNERPQYNNINNINNINKKPHGANFKKYKLDPSFDIDEFFSIAVEHSKNKEKAKTNDEYAE